MYTYIRLQGQCEITWTILIFVLIGRVPIQPIQDSRFYMMCYDKDWTVVCSTDTAFNAQKNITNVIFARDDEGSMMNALAHKKKQNNKKTFQVSS